VRLACRSSGQGADLVLLHGWGMHSGVWSSLAECLAVQHRVHCIDLPGHGHSPPVAAAKPALGWARACLAAAPERAVWVGWSLGGIVSLLAALLAPQRISRLVLVAATPCFVQRADWPHALRQEVLEQFASGLNGDLQATLVRFLALQVRAADSARTTLRRLREELRRCPIPLQSSLEQGLELLRGQDLRSRLAGLECPSLWVFGERDRLVPNTVAEHICSWTPCSRVQVLPGAGHAPFLSHASQVESLLTAFSHDRNTATH